MLRISGARAHIYIDFCWYTCLNGESKLNRRFRMNVPTRTHETWSWVTPRGHLPKKGQRSGNRGIESSPLNIQDIQIILTVLQKVKSQTRVTLKMVVPRSRSVHRNIQPQVINVPRSFDEDYDSLKIYSHEPSRIALVYPIITIGSQDNLPEQSFNQHLVPQFSTLLCVRGSAMSSATTNNQTQPVATSIDQQQQQQQQNMVKNSAYFNYTYCLVNISLMS